MIFALLTALAISGAPERPGVEVVLVVPPGEKPWPDAQERLDPAMQDVRWWYSCQLEAYGHGMKTFSLELDEHGKVVVHIAYLKEAVKPDGEVPRSVIQAADSVCGDVGQRQGTVLLIYYGDYYWSDRGKYQVWPAGRGLIGRWAALNAWHYFSINPAGWNSALRVPKLPLNNPFFPELHTRVLQAFGGDGDRSVAERTSVAYGSIMHELGHAFGLHHPGSHPRGDVMAGDYWNVRGNFLPDILSESCCLSPGDAEVLNKNPLFQRREVRPPSTGAGRRVGMRGAVAG
ncbi:MAG: hypothetical protein ACHQ50_02995 [Fimbriimonadales bacterium]